MISYSKKNVFLEGTINLDRLLKVHKIDTLEMLYSQSISSMSLDVLEALDYELSHRSTTRAKDLHKKVQDLLDQKKMSQKTDLPEKILQKIQSATFSETLEMWRAYAKKLTEPGAMKYQNDIRRFWDEIYFRWEIESIDFFELSTIDSDLGTWGYPNNGILSIFDYSVNQQPHHRKIILIELMKAYIPPILNYDEWGSPMSLKRKQKMRHTLSGLAFPHRNQKSFKRAVKAWDQDLEFLEEKGFI